MPAVRDPLSVGYDTAVRRVLLAAIRARAAGNRRGAHTFIKSPARSFTRLDRGGRTADERAFTRAVYYQVRKVPEQLGQRPDWSVRIRWGKIGRRGGRWGRECWVRVFAYGRGYRHASRLPGSERWAVPGEVAAMQSLPGARIDS